MNKTTVPQAFRCFYEATDFEDTIRNAISIGGDSDTVAAIAGSIAEAYYGIPENIKDNLKLCTNEELQLIDGIIRCILENRNGEKN